MIEFLATVDPMAVPVWGVLVLAASMYPLGLMFGSDCSPCCNECRCRSGQLPETCTVTFSGWPAASIMPLVDLKITSNYGSGAQVLATAPIGTPGEDEGPLGTFHVSSGGSGYAKLGRVAPTLAVSGGSGHSATFVPTLASTNDEFGIPSWGISSVAVSGGLGYVDNETLTVRTSEDDTAETQAVVRVKTAGRSAPSLAAVGVLAFGHAFAVETKSNANTPQTWSVSKVTSTGTKTGFVDNMRIEIVGGPYITTLNTADVRVRTLRTPLTVPTLSATAAGGSGASFTVSTTKAGDNYTVSGVTVTNGGTGYLPGTAVTFTAADGTASVAAVAEARPVRTQPTLTDLWVGRFAESGFVKIDGGAAITPNLVSETIPGEYGTWWRPDSVTIANGGSGYAVGDQFTWSETYATFSPFGDPTPNPAFDPFVGRWVDDSVWSVTSVSGTGAITGVELLWGGYYYRSTGVIESVLVVDGGLYSPAGNDDTGVLDYIQILDGGQYYYYTGTPTSVVVQNAGKYYLEDATKSPYVADTTVSVTQTAPSAGSGAQLSAIIGTTPGPAFGTVTGIQVDDGGTGYLAVRNDAGDKCCAGQLNGKFVVLDRLSSDPCLYEKSGICMGRPISPGTVRVRYTGHDERPTVTLLRGSVSSDATGPNRRACFSGFLEGRSDLVASSLVENCSGFAFTATDPYGRSVSVTSGGAYGADKNGLNNVGGDCTSMCLASGEQPEEIEVEITDGRGVGVNRSGTYVLAKTTFGQTTSDGWNYFEVNGSGWHVPGTNLWITVRLVFGTGAPGDCSPCQSKVSARIWDATSDATGYSGCGDWPRCAPSGSVTAGDIAVNIL